MVDAAMPADALLIDAAGDLRVAPVHAPERLPHPVLRQPPRAGWCGKGGTEARVLRAQVFEATRVQQR
jgi:hypothetical protein